MSQWVLHTVEKLSYSVRLLPPHFNGVIPTLVGPEQALVMEQEVKTLLRKEAIKVIPPRARESPGSTAGTSSFQRRMEGCSQHLHPSPTQKFLRFTFGGEAYHYRVLLFDHSRTLWMLLWLLCDSRVSAH